MKNSIGSYLFLTFNPSYVRHALPILEKMRLTLLEFGSQQAAEIEHQLRIETLETICTAHPACHILAKNVGRMP
ncbi:TPA: hypothetical protein U5D55_001744 [Yersinia enterocolitica]|nr:hypothetical protein [Yersinia enterocolitica]EKN3974228.1 hypothetical protein [Yersinia enterocolitica]HEN3404955.1 hypothetical protein [Yersinia enterocolitica]